MQLENFELLEGRITKLLETLQNLRSENEEIKNQCQDLRVRLEEKERHIQQLTEENEKLRAGTEISNKEREIKERVESLLSKLEEI
ncbi:cell division protein ZapB [candidate division KSB1 bacterium]|nr:cell division protein ZapB [candidate division KSB1 bacterium]